MYNKSMNEFSESDLKELYVPSPDSHKGQNGKLAIIGGSHLFHGASLWGLKIASRIVDMVFYSSIPENNEIVKKLKEEIYEFIAIPRENIENYLEEADCILIGPGMVRSEQKIKPSVDYQIKNLGELNEIEDEGIQTYYLTKYLLNKFKNKKWVIDAGSLTEMDPAWLLNLDQGAILTPHRKEFKMLFGIEASETSVSEMAKMYKSTILFKGPEDLVCSEEECVRVSGGNAGMTKGGTGDVLAGLVAALACKNDLFLSAKAGSFINKKAGEELAKRVGIYFSASDLCDEIPKVMNRLLR